MVSWRKNTNLLICCILIASELPLVKHDHRSNPRPAGTESEPSHMYPSILDGSVSRKRRTQTTKKRTKECHYHPFPTKQHIIILSK
ncbi:hypothetical protein CEXT_579761 [Caerostris extrusa]|uniref:Secreted protein n=1 Tax=Caerostris extrusa TaxID=172846 RepID=A0AAV4YAP2_CAEEX|nr:hypothetical protein CEXT_579761 [Caerostris extrusa]